VLADAVGLADLDVAKPGGAQDASRLAEHGGLGAGEIQDAVGDDDVDGAGVEGDALDAALAREFVQLSHADSSSRAAGLT
jgi:hypothetical protein